VWWIVFDLLNNYNADSDALGGLWCPDKFFGTVVVRCWWLPITITWLPFIPCDYSDCKWRILQIPVVPDGMFHAVLQELILDWLHHHADAGAVLPVIYCYLSFDSRHCWIFYVSHLFHSRWFPRYVYPLWRWITDILITDSVVIGSILMAWLMPCYYQLFIVFWLFLLHSDGDLELLWFLHWFTLVFVDCIAIAVILLFTIIVDSRSEVPFTYILPVTGDFFMEYSIFYGDALLILLLRSALICLLEYICWCITVTFGGLLRYHYDLFVLRWTFGDLLLNSYYLLPFYRSVPGDCILAVIVTCDIFCSVDSYRSWRLPLIVDAAVLFMRYMEFVMPVEYCWDLFWLRVMISPLPWLPDCLHCWFLPRVIRLPLEFRFALPLDLHCSILWPY